MSKEDSVTLYKYMPLKYAADAIKNGRLYLNITASIVCN